LNAEKLRSQRELNLIDSSLDGPLNANSLNIDGDLLIDRARLKEVNLNNAKMKGSFSANGSSIYGSFNANGLQIDGDFTIAVDDYNPSTFKMVFMNNVKVNGNLNIAGASINGTLFATMLRVGGNLSIASVPEDLKEFAQRYGVAVSEPRSSQANFKSIILIGSAVEGNLYMYGPVLDGEFSAAALRVGGSMYMRNAQCLGEVDLNMVHIGGNLDLNGATLTAGFDLSSASIGGDLQLGGGYKSAVWQGNNAVLYLRNARIGNLVDATDAWPGPGRLHLDGFPFSHLGGSNGATGQDMRKRGATWWDD